MYNEFFGISEKPFSMTPDPRYLYMSKSHQEALAHLLYGVTEGGCFVLLTGEVGTGKTSICRCLLNQLPENIHLALILNSRLTKTELLASICDELGIDYPENLDSIKGFVDRLNAFLLAAHAKGERVVVMIDEAQNSSVNVLEQIRLLTNLQTEKENLLQVLLVGQPELLEMLRRPELRQLNQRITARFHLTPLPKKETRAYIQHRLAVAGMHQNAFRGPALAEIAKHGRGIPRIINSICDRCLLGAYAQGSQHVTRSIAKAAVKEVLGRTKSWSSGLSWRWGTAVAGTAAVFAFLALVPWKSVDLQKFVKSVTDTTAVASSNEAEVQKSEAPTPVALAAVAAENTLPAQQAAQPASETGDPEAEAGEPETAAAGPVPEAGDQAEPPAAELEQTAALEVLKELAPQDSLTPLDSLLKDPSLARDRSAALTTLFSAWGLELDTANLDEPCGHIKPLGLACASGEAADWSDLSKLDRPALIKLAPPDGSPLEAVVTTLTPGEVGLSFGDREIRLARTAVAPYWHGDYLIFDRAKQLVSRTLRVGVDGDDVTWLKNQLARLRGEDLAATGTSRFDDRLRDQVIAFQSERDLSPDGIVGPRTLEELYKAVNESQAPSLSAPGT